MTPRRPVYVCGDTPSRPVLLLHELFGADEPFLNFGRRIAAKGFMVYVPILFGGVGKNATPMRAAMDWLKRPCLLAEFAVLAKNSSSPIVNWLRVLGRMIYEDAKRNRPLNGIGVIGLCLTGNFALTMMLDKWVVAPIVSEPALPGGFSKAAREALHLSKEERCFIRARIAEGAQILAFRFAGDGKSPAARYENMKHEFAPGFIGCGHLDPPEPGAHRVLSGGYTSPSAESAFEQVVAFLHDKLS